MLSSFALTLRRACQTQRRALPLLLVAVLGSAASGCISYAVGTTAQSVPTGKVVRSDVLEVVRFVSPSLDCTDLSNRPEDCDDPLPVRPNLSADIRYGIDEKSDVGVRFIGYSGFVGSYKRRLTSDSAAVEVAILGGAGLVNLFQYGQAEATLIVSPRALPDDPLVPYAGARVMQSFRLSNSVPSDRPTVGAFAGIRIGTSAIRVSPELGVFYDRSALDPSRSPLMVVPSFTIIGIGILKRLAD